MNCVLWSGEIDDDWYGDDVPEGSDETSEDDKSSSYRSGSIVSSSVTRDSNQRSQTNLSVLSRSDRSTSYTRFTQSEKTPSAESEGQILDLLAGSGYPMTQINGQRKLGPPPGWTKPIPDPSCEVFVGKIPRDLYEDAIYPIFHNIGEIYEIRLMMDFSGTNRGYCFVMFAKTEYAKQAIKQLNNWEIRKGRRIGVVASINNCRLSIGQLPPHIESEIVIEKFHDMTDEVSKVSVYRNLNGQVRYALVSYQTHRGAAMARRRLLPERGSLFEHGEITIDWAHPDTSPNNVVEEIGVRDENGKLKISKIEIRSRAGGSQRRGRDDFLEKSIKNYLREKNGAQSLTHQRNKSLESSEKSFAHSGSFSARRKSQKIRSNQQKSYNDQQPRSRKENYLENFANNSTMQWHSSRKNFSNSANKNLLWYPTNRDVNGNIEITKNSSSNETKSTINDQTNLSSQELDAGAKNFVPKTSLSFNLFEHYTLVPEMPVVDSVNLEQTPGDRSMQSFFKNQTYIAKNSSSNNLQSDERTNNAKSRIIDDFEISKSVENFSPMVNGFLEKSKNDSSNSLNERKNFRQTIINENPKNSERSRNLQNFRVLGEITNKNGISEINHENNSGSRGFVKNHGNTTTKKNNSSSNDQNIYPQSYNYCKDCHEQAKYYVQKNVNYQPSIVNNRYATPVFDNYFRGINERSVNNSTSNVQRRQQPREEILFPLGRIVSQSFYGTSSFADYRLPQIYTDKGTNPRPILNRDFHEKR